MDVIFRKELGAVIREDPELANLCESITEHELRKGETYFPLRDLQKVPVYAGVRCMCGILVK